ncbi:MAG: hypothetical protein ACK2T6_05740 [Anaerolineae bacterium]
MHRMAAVVMAMVVGGLATASCVEASQMIMEPSLPAGEDVLATQTAAAGAGSAAASGMPEEAAVVEWPGRVRQLSGLEPLGCGDLLDAAAALDDETAALLVTQYVDDLSGLLREGAVGADGAPVDLTAEERAAIESHLGSLRDADGYYCGVVAP